MDQEKLMLCIQILGICLSVVLTYIFVANIIFHVPNTLLDIGILSFSWVVTIKFNPTFRHLIHKWFKKK